MAFRAVGTTYPNPPVGAIIVKNGSILARGWTQPNGTPHAEIHAINQVKNKKDTSPTNTKTTLSLKSYFDEQQNVDDEPLPILDKGKSLKVDDIVGTQSYVDTIRDYMIDRKGKQYLNKDAEEAATFYVKFINFLKIYNRTICSNKLICTFSLNNSNRFFFNNFYVECTRKNSLNVN